MQNAKNLLDQNFQALQSTLSRLDTEKAALQAEYLTKKEVLEGIPEDLAVSGVVEKPYCADICIRIGDQAQLASWLQNYPPEPCVALTDGQTFKPVRCLRPNEEAIRERALPFELKGRNLIWWSTVEKKSVQILVPDVDTVDFVLANVDLKKFEPFKQSYPRSGLRVWISRKKRYSDLVYLSNRLSPWYRTWDALFEEYGTNEKRRQYLRALKEGVKHKESAQESMERIKGNSRLAAHHLVFSEELLKDIAKRFEESAPLYHQAVAEIHMDLERVASWLKAFHANKGRPKLRENCTETLQYLLARDLKLPAEVGGIQFDVTKNYFEVLVTIESVEQLIEVPFDTSAPAFDLRTMEEYY